MKKKYYNKLYICQQNIFLILNEKQSVIDSEYIKLVRFIDYLGHDG